MLTSHYLDLLRYYRKTVLVMFVCIVGGVAAFSALFLYVIPLYTATAKISILPTQTELAYSQNFVRSSSTNPANLMTQTHIENLISREVARLTIDRLTGGPEKVAEAAALSEQQPVKGFSDRFKRGFRVFRNTIRRVYNTLNSGKHVSLDPYTDLVISLQEAIEIEMVEGSYILEVAVSWDSPEVAAKAANVLADVYVERGLAQAREAAATLEADLRAQMASGRANIAELESQINTIRLASAASISQVRVIDPAVPPIYPSFPRIVIYTIFALAGWMVLVVFVVIAADTFSATVKTCADLVRVMGARALGSLRLNMVPGAPETLRMQGETARHLRMQGATAVENGAVVSLGAEGDSQRMARFVSSALSVDGRGAVVRSLGGASETFRAGETAVPQWLVIGMRPGTISDVELEAIVAQWQERGVQRVFGLLIWG